MARHSTDTCPTCGSHLEYLQLARLERCKACGRSNPAGFSFCGHCGVSMASLDDEADPFDAMLEEVISSMEPEDQPSKPARPEPPRRAAKPARSAKPAKPVQPKKRAAPRRPVGPPPAPPPRMSAEEAFDAAQTQPPRRPNKAKGKSPATKKLATSTKPKPKPKRQSVVSSKRPAVPSLGFHRPSAPPVSSEHPSTRGAPAKTKVRRRSTVPVDPATVAAAATPPAPAARTGYTTVVPALQPPRPYGGNHPGPERVPTSKLRAAAAAARRAAAPMPVEPEAPAAAPVATPAASPPKQPRRRRYKASFGADVLARYKR